MVREKKKIDMRDEETLEERKERFKSMSSAERKALIREKMKAEGLVEGSGVSGKDLSSYDQEEIPDLIQVTRFFPEMQSKRSAIQSEPPKKNKLLIPWILLAIALACGMALYYKQYPSLEIRRQLSVDGVFMD